MRPSSCCATRIAQLSVALRPFDWVLIGPCERTASFRLLLSDRVQLIIWQCVMGLADNPTSCARYRQRAATKGTHLPHSRTTSRHAESRRRNGRIQCPVEKEACDCGRRRLWKDVAANVPAPCFP